MSEIPAQQPDTRTALPDYTKKAIVILVLYGLFARPGWGIVPGVFPLIYNLVYFDEARKASKKFGFRVEGYRFLTVLLALGGTLTAGNVAVFLLK